MTPSPLGAYGSCSIAATALPVGSYKVSATYAGDTDLKSSSGTAAVGLTVTGAATTTGLSLSPSSVTYGNETTEVFSATVTSSAGTPSGTVTVGSSAGTLCQITLVSGSGSCRLSATQLAVGTISSVVATYNASWELRRVDVVGQAQLRRQQGHDDHEGLGEPDNGQVRCGVRFGLHGDSDYRATERPSRTARP